VRKAAAILVGAGGGIGLFACSLFIPFSAYDSEPAAQGDGGAAAESGPQGGDAGTCDADLSNDNANCGACGRACGACLAGLCPQEPFYQYSKDSPIYMVGIALDSDYVYGGGALVGFDAGSPGAIARIAKVTHTGAAIAITLAPVARVAIADPEVFWTQGAFGDAGTAEHGIGRAPKVPPTDAGVALPYVGGQTSPFAIAVDHTTVYWSNYGLNAAGFDLWSASLSDASTARAITPPEGVAGVAVDSTAIYYSLALPTGKIFRANKDGTSPQAIAENQSSPFLLALDDSYVYWTELTSGGSVSRVQKDGGAVLQIATSQDKPNLIAVNDTYVYWTNYAQGSLGTLNRAPKAGGKSILLAINLTNPSDIAVDETYVYVVTNGGIFRVPK
jgi:hypothetical protein